MALLDFFRIKQLSDPYDSFLNDGDWSFDTDLPVVIRGILPNTDGTIVVQVLRTNFSNNTLTTTNRTFKAVAGINIPVRARKIISVGTTLTAAQMNLGY
jgi:hypothetical protein